MRAWELEAALAEHDALVQRCVQGELSFEDFLVAYDCFYMRWALDGHEGDQPLLVQFADRITVHRRIWEEVESRITSADHAATQAHHGILGPDEGLRRLSTIARECGLPSR